MRNHLIAELYELAQKDSKIYLMTGDLGYGVLNRFQERFPDRFVNAGISEQNMASVAAGMALEGNTVYLYSIGNFPGMRCLEQIRNDICYPNANVKIIVVGGGFAYGQLGMSHHATEDLAVMRALPNMRVYSPADPTEAVEVIRRANSVHGPCYIRLGKGGEPELHPEMRDYSVEKLMQVIPGEGVAILATGSILGQAMEAARLLRECRGVRAAVYNVMCLKPLDEKAIIAIGREFTQIVTVEEHNIIGGLGGAVAEVLAGEPAHGRLLRIGLRDEYPSVVGSQSYLRGYYGISAEHIAERIEERL